MKIEEVRAALARGYCKERNSKKVLDFDLCEAQTAEIMKIFDAKSISSRSQVYEAIDSERDYQDSLERNSVNREDHYTFSPMTNLAIIEEICTRAKAEFYDKPGHPDPSYMRKIAATAVRAMESFGAPLRSVPKE